MHISHTKSFNIPVSIALATLPHMINVYEMCLNTTNYPIFNMQDFRYCPWTYILDCFGQLVSPSWLCRTPHTNNSQSLYTHTHNVNNVRVCKVGCELITVKIWHEHGCCVYVYMSMSSQCVLSGAMGWVIKSADHSLLPPWIHYSLKTFQIPCISTYPNRLAYGCKDAFILYWVTEIYYVCSLITI